MNRSRLILRVGLEAAMILLIAGLIGATVLPVIVGRSNEVDRMETQRDRNRPPARR